MRNIFPLLILLIFSFSTHAQKFKINESTQVLLTTDKNPSPVWQKAFGWIDIDLNQSIIRLISGQKEVKFTIRTKIEDEISYLYHCAFGGDEVYFYVSKNMKEILLSIGNTARFYKVEKQK